MKAQINSNLFKIINVGMYNSRLSPENLFDDYTVNQDYEDGYINVDSEYYNDHWNNDLFTIRIEELAGEFLDGTIENHGIEITIEAGDIYSPKFYNFKTDNIDLNVTYNKHKVLRYAKDHQDEFEAFLKDNYSSYDGFMSFTANNYIQWLNEFRDNDQTAVGAVLNFIFSDSLEDYHESFYQFVEENTSHSDFINFEFYETEESIIADYIQSHYNQIDMEALIDSYEWEAIKEDRVEKIANSLIQKIDNQTLNLFEDNNN